MANKKKTEIEEKTKKTSATKTTKKKTNVAKKETTKTTNKEAAKTTPKKQENKVVKEEKKKVEKIVKEEMNIPKVPEEDININEDIEIDDGFSSNKSSSNIGITLAIIIILALMIIIIFIAGTKGSYNDSTSTLDTSTITNDAGSDSASIKDEEKADLTSIDIDKYLALKKSSDSYSVIYIGRPTCSHCVVQKPIMEHLVYKYNIVINYLDTDTLSDDDIDKFRDSDEYFSEGWGTPLTLIVKDNKIVDKIEGEASISTVTELLKKYSIISE